MRLMTRTTSMCGAVSTPRSHTTTVYAVCVYHVADSISTQLLIPLQYIQYIPTYMQPCITCCSCLLCRTMKIESGETTWLASFALSHARSWSSLAPYYFIGAGDTSSSLST